MATTDEIRRIRNLIPDTDAIYGVGGDEYLFTDENISDFFTDGNENVKWAAGLAKMAVGGSEALVLKVIRNYETTTDGAELMRQWTISGLRLMEQGMAEVDAQNVADYFEITAPTRLGDTYIIPEAVPHHWSY